jgi:hypothetical protein
MGAIPMVPIRGVNIAVDIWPRRARESVDFAPILCAALAPSHDIC